MKIYVLHYKKLIERKEHIKNEFKKYNLNYEFYEKFDKEELNNEDLKIFNNNLRDSEKSLTLKHINIYKEISNSNFDYALIFEDDVFLENDFNNILNKYITLLPNDWDMLFIGNGCNLHVNDIIKDKFIYKKDSKNSYTRCTDSYLISKKCATKITNYIDNLHNLNKFPYIHSPIDFLLNDILKNINANVYWCEPTIVSQGSQKQGNCKTKRFESSIKG